MPSIVTHYLFSEQVLEKTTNKIKRQIEPNVNLYHIFAQSFDNLFYYNLLNLKKGKHINTLKKKYKPGSGGACL